MHSEAPSLLTEELKRLFDRIYSLLQFAEAKNVGLIAFNSAIIVGMLTIFPTQTATTPDFYINIQIYIILLNSISLILCLFAIHAIQIPTPIKTNISANDNLLFFGTISQFTAQNYIDSFSKKYGFVSKNKNYDLDLTKEIIMIAQILIRKLNLFNWALVFTLSSLLSPLIMIFHLVIKRNKNKK